MKAARKKAFILVSVLALVAVSGVYIISLTAGEEKFVSPRRGKIVDAIYGLGKVKTRRKYEVKVGVMSKIEKVHVDEGQKVRKNDPLVKFSDFGTVRSPFAGTVTSVVFREPENVFPNTAVLTVEDLGNRYIEVSLEQEGALQTRIGQKAIALFESVRGVSYQGEVESIYPKEDEFLVHIEVEGLKRNILPGMTADVTINVAARENALLIPLTGVSQGKALIKRDGKEIKVPVTIGAVEGEWGEVLKGDIRSGDKVLAPGAR